MPELSRRKLAAFSRFAHQLADLSVDILLGYFRSGVSAEGKTGKGESIGFDPVTEADRRVECAIRDAIKAAWPDHGIVGEEFASHGEDNAFVWRVDPIDGTRSFLAGLPTWGTLIGLAHEGRNIIGLMSQPFTGERYWSDGVASHYRGPGGERRLATSDCAKIENALLATTDPYWFDEGEEARAFARLRDSARMTRYGGDCYSYCLLAAGFIDIIVESGLNSFDIAGLVPIVRDAGGVITTWQGDPPDEGGQIVATANSALHEKVLRILAPAANG